MSDEPNPKPPEEEEELPEGALEEDSALRSLLKRSLAVPEEPKPASPAHAGPPAPSEADKALLQAVQRKLRQRSKGKFYADGWSTTQSRVSYALVAVIMLVTIVVVYLALGPTGIH